MAHYYSEKQDSEFLMKEFSVDLLGNSLRFKSAAGVFSKGAVDKGSRLLIENAVIKEGWDVLDLGCGYGPVGIAIAKRYRANVLMSEVNTRALNLARQNIKANGIHNAKAVRSSLFENIAGNFDAILLNPPQSAGKKVCYTLIETAKDHLKPQGLFQLVARHNKGGKDLSLFMQTVFGNVRELAKSGGYRVYASTRSP